MADMSKSLGHVHISDRFIGITLLRPQREPL
jgi:hypothetical protein